MGKSFEVTFRHSALFDPAHTALTTLCNEAFAVAVGRVRTKLLHMQRHCRAHGSAIILEYHDCVALVARSLVLLAHTIQAFPELLGEARIL